MPELPEVQTFVNDLNSTFAGKTVVDFHLHRPNLRMPFDIAFLQSVFGPKQNQSITLLRFSRIGKLMRIATSTGEVEISLGMTGRFSPATPRKPALHEHITLIFSDETALGFVDPRRFGFWRKPQPNQVADPLVAAELREAFASTRMRQSARSIKEILMDQTFIGGIGNIYAAEALFRAGIHPQRSGKSLSLTQLRKLETAIPPLLNQAIAARGSTISSYQSLNGESGSFQQAHAVYGRTNEPCLKRGCNGIIVRLVQGGRSTWCCPFCQK